MSSSLPLIILCGLSGTGKTFHSKILEKRLAGYTHLNLGDLREKLGITSYSRKDTPKLLALAVEQIEKNHHQHLGTIFDANLKSVDLRQCFYDLAKSLQQEVILVELVCSEETTKQRMARREQISKIENPKDPKVYDYQKRLWQDTLLDLEDGNNSHLTLIRFNNEKNQPELVLGNAPSRPFIQNLISILKNK